MFYVLTCIASAVISERWLFEADDEEHARALFDDGLVGGNFISDQIDGEEENREIIDVEELVDDVVSLTHGIGGTMNAGCIRKARPGEPVFILMGRDPDAATLVREWAARRNAACHRAGLDPAHALSAVRVADAMDAYAADPAHAPNSAPPADAYPPTPAETYALARSATDQLTLTQLTVRCLRTLTLSALALPGAEQAKAWLREYIDGTNPGHGPLGSPMQWPHGNGGVEALLRGWGFQPTPTSPSYVAQVQQ